MIGDTVETQTTGPLEARKDDDGKLSYSLLPPDALAELVAVYNLGARKYSRGNWANGMEWHRVFDAMQRHSWAFWNGQNVDPVDGQHHLASVAWAALTLIAYQKRGIGKDDRVST
ncbi:hypothetical protein CU669_15145 [Paramagnetospirillum kuznetsovii]|uniref:dATP/dGTP diphosphohydrolase N-terminal domain-containing protein n=1 Tax=Paramagnetospirillum kuznetsovii TaxID=2053833 RepID=A0A364NVH7_9PROT|nr:dATP/dGTP diphosphohydrolase domain-containing protein [Paramagnetospirillum kuznetsovii]RAU21088.1 hypothetical protein CU669_15145 [Paramagnetospirillum kuznetsovii]